MIDILDIEQTNHLIRGEDLLVAVRPAEANKIIEHCFRQIALLTVIANIDRPVPLG